MTFPRWLSWLFVAFLAYILIVGNYNAPAPSDRPVVTAEEPAVKDYPKIRALVDGNRWLTAINPDYVPPEAACALPASDADALAPYALVIIEGDGVPAECGDDMTVTLVRWNANGTRGEVMEDGSLILGEQKGLDGLLMGMRPGEERLVNFTPAETFSAYPMLKKGQRQTLTVHRTDGVPPAEPVIEKAAD